MGVMLLNLWSIYQVKVALLKAKIISAKKSNESALLDTFSLIVNRVQSDFTVTHVHLIIHRSIPHTVVRLSFR